MIRIFRHYISGVYLILFFLELGVFAAAFSLGNLLRHHSLAHDLMPQENLWVPSAILTVVMLVSSTGMGIYQRSHESGDAALLLRIASSFMLGTAIMSLVFYLFPDVFVGRGLFGFALLVALTGVLLCRFLFLKSVDRQSLKRRVLVLGTGYRGNMIREFERRNSNHRFRVVGYVRMNEEPLRIEEDRLVELKSLKEFAQQADIDEIVVAPDDRRGGGLVVDDALDCKMAGVEVVDLVTFFEREGGLLRVDCLNPSWLLFSDGFRVTGGQQFVKRLFDILASLLLLVLIWPVMLLTIAAIKLESGLCGDWHAPILYRQRRVGLHGETFKVVKFRSMRTDAEKAGAMMALANDSRITRVGWFIRKTRIDELPQLFNVLKGQMSFVGPRPERPEFVDKFNETIPYYAERHRLKPGITGWAQLCYPYGSNYQDTIEKLQYDLYYVKNYSIFLDMLIILQTVEVVLWGKGAR